MDPLSAGLIGLVSGVIDKIFPDKAGQEAEKAKALLELRKLEQSGELEAIKIQMSAIVAEASSSDPWTSRSRPSFLYVMYVLILASIPMGFLAAYKPELAGAVAAGMQSWLSAIPESLWTVFGVGYLGYTGARSYEKAKKVS